MPTEGPRGEWQSAGPPGNDVARICAGNGVSDRRDGLAAFWRRIAGFSAHWDARIHHFSEFFQRTAREFGCGETGDGLAADRSGDIAILPNPLPFACGQDLQFPTG